MTITASSSAPLVEGRDSLTLDCDVDSNPTPSIAWFKDLTDGSGNGPTEEREPNELGSDRQFSISTVSRHDAGTYTCIATNLLGDSMQKDIYIDVQCK